MKKILYILTAVLIIAGITVTVLNGLKYNFDIKGGTKLRINIAREFDVKDIENIAKEVLNSDAQVEKTDLLGESVAITSQNIPDEKIDEIITKLNEKYETDEFKKENAAIVNIPNVRVRDLISNYIFPLIFATVVSLVYIAFIGKNKIFNILSMATGIILSALLLLSMLAILRITIDKGILMSGVITYILTILFILMRFVKGEEEGTNNNLFIAIACFLSSIGIVIAGIFTNRNILVSSGIELIIGILIALYVSVLIGISKNTDKETKEKR